MTRSQLIAGGSKNLPLKGVFLWVAVISLLGCSQQAPSEIVEDSSASESNTSLPQQQEELEEPQPEVIEAAYQLPPQFIPSDSAVTISGFPVTELETVMEHHKNLHKSVILVSDSGVYGTAWLIRPDLAVTVAHGVDLLRDPERVQLVLFDGTRIKGSTVLSSEEYDLALFKLDEAVDLPVLQLSEAIPKQNEPVFSIGHPGNLSGGYKMAWVTNLGVMAGYQDSRTSFIRTTIPTVGGQSGSPIFDVAGKVVAINGHCSSTTYGSGESIRAKVSDQLSYFSPREECGGPDATVLRWFLDQYDSGSQVENMPGWPDWRDDEYVSPSSISIPQQLMDVSSGKTLSGFPIAELENVEELYEELKRSVVMMDVGDVYSKSGGTGWLVSEDLVLTNEHVLPFIGEDLPVRVETYDGQMIGAVELARDSQYDLALLRLEKPVNVAPLTLSEQELDEGSPVFSIGHPSAVTRSWVTTVGVLGSRDEPDAIFSSIPSSQGSSGSPMLNLEGEVVGIIWGTRGFPEMGLPEPAPSSLQISYLPPIPETAATRVKEIREFIAANSE